MSNDKKAPLFSEARESFDPSKLSPKERRIYEVSRNPEGHQDDESKYLAEEGDKVLAAFKIEVHFGKGRTMNGPNVLALLGWESGKRLHGGGDEMIYWCKDFREGHDEGCWGPIFGSDIVGGIAYCRNCQNMVKASYLTGQRFMKVTTKTLAEHVARIFRLMDYNADIYVKYAPDDIRYMALERKRGLEEARRLRGLLIYPLRNILKDTSAGASLENMFNAFFRS